MLNYESESVKIMIIIEPEIFNQFPEIKCGFSTKSDTETVPPFHFNLSASVGDDPDAVLARKERFYKWFGLTPSDVATQHQVHEDSVTFVTKPGLFPLSDALVTDVSGLGLVVSSADCLPVFVYDKKNMVIAGIHSGWKSSEKKIVRKTIQFLEEKWNSHPDNLYVYFGPSISGEVYEVGPEVAEKFPSKYIIPLKEKFLLNIPLLNFDFLTSYGIPEKNIQVSRLCTFNNRKLLHSYRREGPISGRAVGLIMMKVKN